MAFLTTGRDLALDALGLAGEPTDGNSQYEEDVYEWLTVVQRAIVSGGQLGPVVLPTVDWLWSQARGYITLSVPFNANGASLGSFTQGSASMVIYSTTTDLTGYRVEITGQDPRPRILGRVDSTTWTLEAPWSGDTVTTTSWIAYPDTYALPVDFARGVGPLRVHASPWSIDVVSEPDLEARFPTALVQSGTPCLAGRGVDGALRFSHHLSSTATKPVLMEYLYVRQPDPVESGSVPVLPLHHRRVLSLGCAALILEDKDDSGAESLWQQFQGAHAALRNEHIRSAMRMSSLAGVVRPRDVPSVVTPTTYYW